MSAKITVKRKGNFTTVPNEILMSKELSLRAKGLLVYMLSLPNDWNYSVAGLVASTGEGKTALQGALKELEKAGYLVRTQVKDNGKFAHNDYIVYDTPHKSPLAEKPLTEKPLTEKPSAEKPSAENLPQENTNKENTNKLNTLNRESNNSVVYSGFETKRKYFNRFWSSYPRKVKEFESWYEWQKLPYDTELYERIIKSVEDYKTTNQWQDVNYIPFPNNYLQDQRYNDEIPVVKADTMDVYEELKRKYEAESNGHQ